jgi:hypothetical protein
MRLFSPLNLLMAEPPAGLTAAPICTIEIASLALLVPEKVSVPVNRTDESILYRAGVDAAAGLPSLWCAVPARATGAKPVTTGPGERPRSLVITVDSASATVEASSGKKPFAEASAPASAADGLYRSAANGTKRTIRVAHL